MSSSLHVSTTLHRVFLAGSVIALRSGHKKVSCAHLLTAMLAPELHAQVAPLLLRHGITNELIAANNGAVSGPLGSLEPARVGELPDGETVLHALDVARRVAIGARSSVVTPEHMLIGIINCGDPGMAWFKQKLPEEVARRALDLPIPLSRGMRRAVATASVMAHALGAREVNCAHVLLTCLHDPFSRVTSWMRASGVPVEEVSRVVDARGLGGHALPWLRAHGPLYESAASAAEATEAMERDAASRAALPMTASLFAAIETAVLLTRCPASTEAVVGALLVDGASFVARAVDAVLAHAAAQRERHASLSRGRRMPPPMLHAAIHTRGELIRKLFTAMNLPPHVVAAATDEAHSTQSSALPAEEHSGSFVSGGGAGRGAGASGSSTSSTSSSSSSRSNVLDAEGSDDVARAGSSSSNGDAAEPVHSTAAHAADADADALIHVDVGVTDVVPTPSPQPTPRPTRPWREFLCLPHLPRITRTAAAPLPRADGVEGDRPPAVSALTHAGPTSSSNWLVPGRVLVGARPAPDDVRALLGAGIRTFVSLVGQHLTTHWRLRGYPATVADLLAATSPSSGAGGGDNAECLHMPITDVGTVPPALLEVLVTDLVERVRRGEVLYIHCMGGHSRTGKIAAMTLRALYASLSEAEAQAYVQQAYAMRALCYSWHSHFKLSESIGKSPAQPTRHSSFYVPTATPQQHSE